MWCHLKNLAGRDEADKVIEHELRRARIPAVKVEPSKGEVRYTLEGKLGDFRFYRAWTYWVVHGPMPVAAARDLYGDPVGKEDIRVAGHCGCPPPEKPWVTWRSGDGRKLATLKDKGEFDQWIESGHFKRDDIESKYVFVGKPEETGTGYVESYHIDSEVGLRIFADAVRALEPAKVGV